MILLCNKYKGHQVELFSGLRRSPAIIVVVSPILYFFIR